TVANINPSKATARPRRFIVSSMARGCPSSSMGGLAWTVDHSAGPIQPAAARDLVAPVARHSVSRTRCSALSALTRAFDVLWRCTADAGPRLLLGHEKTGVPGLRRVTPLHFLPHRAQGRPV